MPPTCPPVRKVVPSSGQHDQVARQKRKHMVKSGTDICGYCVTYAQLFRDATFQANDDHQTSTALLTYLQVHHKHRISPIISRTPNSDCQSLCFENFPQLDQQTSADDSSYILCMNMHV